MDLQGLVLSKLERAAKQDLFENSKCSEFVKGLLKFDHMTC